MATITAHSFITAHITWLWRNSDSNQASASPTPASKDITSEGLERCNFQKDND